jgi:long-chain acyl-CoA synthetase
VADYPWLNNYDKGVPHTLQPYPDITLLDVIKENAAQGRGQAMIWFKGNTISYQKFVEYVELLARALAGLGVKKGDRVALMMPNCPQIIISQFAVWRAGGIAAQVNPLFSEDELIHALKDCGAETVIVLTPFYDQVKKVQTQTNVKRVIATSIKEYLSPFMRAMFTLLMEKKQGHRIELQAGDLWFQDIMRKYAGAPLPAVAIGPQDTALILFSGGTTGTPKGVMHSHRGIVMNAMQIRAWTSPIMKGWVDKAVLLMPIFHGAGNWILISTIVNPPVPIVLIPNPRDIKDLLTTFKKTRPTFFPGVATLFIALMNHPDVKSGKIDFSNLKMCITAAAPLLVETKKSWEALTGGRIVEAYGLTESGILVMGPVVGKWKEGSVGMPTPDVAMKIVDIDTGTQDLKTGEDGEIIVKAPHLMQGYWNRPEATAEMFRGEWQYTGDIGHLDEDGYLFITSRKKELIKPSGHQVYPGEVEEIITKHPAVLEVSVAGVRDDLQGEAVKAWIVLKPGQSSTPQEIQAFCKERLTAYKVPKHVEFRTELPKSMVGKVMRRLLQEEDIARQKEKK